MSFTIDELNGYKQGQRYEEQLKFIKMYGNSNKRYVVLKDTKDNELHWTTRDSTKTFQDFKNNGVYRFTVDYIIDYNKEIKIKLLRLIK